MSYNNLWNLIPQSTKGFLETSIKDGRICSVPQEVDVFQTLKAMVTFIADVVEHDYTEFADGLLDSAICTMKGWKAKPKYVGFVSTLGFNIIHIFTQCPINKDEEEYVDVLPEKIEDFTENIGYYLAYGLNLDD